ncbi:MAG: S26 family signal peptidase [Rhodospirillales bacterium]|jgi:conjugative transfer signal peptidase TraF|nr:S26 family signal peptidase [Rhodospirillales bacterium]
MPRAVSARRGLRLVAAAIGGIAAIAVAAELWGRQQILYNHSPSLPEGFYVRTSADRPAVGTLVRFPVPETVRAYARQRGADEEHASFLKPVIAGAGDHVCIRGDRFILNGRDVGAVAAHDSAGRPLPRWRECRALVTGELFVYADHVANSFDSRYYGPIRTDAVTGVYTPLWTF